MGIFNLFSNTQQPQQPQQQPQQQQPAPAAPTAATNANGVAVPGAANPQNATTPTGLQQSQTASPLDTFTDMFKAKPKTEGEQVPTLNDPFIHYDPASIAESVNKFNFVDQNLASKAQAALQGDPNALVDMMQGVARAVFMKSAQLSATVADRATAEGVNRLQAHIPNVIKSNSVTTALEQLNPQFRHEAAKPMVDAITKQFQENSPNLTPVQIAEMTAKYLNALTGYDPEKQQQQQKQSLNPFAPTQAQQDFENFFSTGNPFQ